jgi:predicted nuclease of restriction endonuclease-like (RecB) superfamily
MGNDLFSDKEYKAWIIELKTRIKQSQMKASMRVNSSMLELYWSIGADIVGKQAESKWGSSVIEQLSKDLRSEFPKMQGFSITNLRYMKRFYLLWQNATKLVANYDIDAFHHQLGGENTSSEETGLLQLNESDYRFPRVLSAVPWRHHVEIFSHSKSPEEAMFYILKTAENGWSRRSLQDNLKSDLYSRQGKAPNNFTHFLPLPQSALAGEMLKDPYNFDFISLRDEYIEDELEDALVAHVTKLLLELGQGFAFLGQQVPVMAGTKELFIDLLFYHVDLHCYIVVELKAQEFEASFTGQLGAYVSAVNHQKKKEIDSPTIGLLICKSKNDVYAEYSLESSSHPIGISAYELSNLLPEEFKSTLPSIEEIEATLKDEDKKY